jgi:hypothetical protein
MNSPILHRCHTMCITVLYRHLVGTVINTIDVEAIGNPILEPKKLDANTARKIVNHHPHIYAWEQPLEISTIKVIIINSLDHAKAPCVPRPETYPSCRRKDILREKKSVVEGMLYIRYNNHTLIPDRNENEQALSRGKTH